MSPTDSPVGPWNRTMRDWASRRATGPGSGLEVGEIVASVMFQSYRRGSVGNGQERFCWALRWRGIYETVGDYPSLSAAMAGADQRLHFRMEEPGSPAWAPGQRVIVVDRSGLERPVTIEVVGATSFRAAGVLFDHAGRGVGHSGRILRPATPNGVERVKEKHRDSQ